MAVASSSSMSPPESDPPTMTLGFDDSKRRIQGPLPLQQAVKSASQIPGSPTRASMSTHLASSRYVQQCRALLDRQRQVFDDERALWHTERMDLHEKIGRLEGSIRRYEALSSSQVSSPISKNGAASGAPWNLSNLDRSSTASGDEFWRGAGGKSDAQPIRTFSESSTQSVQVRERLSSIAEDTSIPKIQRSFSNNTKTRASLPNASMDSGKVDQSLDGINFKLSGTTFPTVQSIITAHSPSVSPRHSPSLSQMSPGTNTVPMPASHDPYTKDAGHTPRPSKHSPDGFSSVPVSDPATPTRSELEKPPLEPRISNAKIPSERASSYFPQDLEQNNEDPELEGPLGLKNDNVEDNSFLFELDSKLQQAAKEKISEVSEVCASGADLAVEEKVFDQPEPEPKLRIKRSMNFGSQLGHSGCGKGF